MSSEILNQLESKIQQAIDTIGLLQLEIEELKEQKQLLEHQLAGANAILVTLQEENQRLKQEQVVWQERLQSLLGRMADLS
ncbi:cell division protein ZapB [Candidatus Schmidhempelia bombi]|jgi:cell division protein ZapB|uniref:Cell division protein ZapB n=1 Tax=Candidatus Schmidhempelia bombi str. Bimp TaxID=1387197 RepID=A0AB94IDX8_9GAMM|nr:cell division protein ZapB [Candidatus Schmidhempelia bombi]TEA27670.1 cell division protein ZapB [Candidatus Schmidhempelia bombi str. Bimp]